LPPTPWTAWRLTANVLPARLRSLPRALELAATEEWGFGRRDVARVEANWEMLEDHSIAHGFVLTRRTDQRVYLQYIAAYEGDDVDEDVQTLPMRDERYPPIGGWRHRLGRRHRRHHPLARRLDVEPQQVIPGQAESADRWLSPNGAMWSMPVVAMGEEGQFLGALL
jgi:hypothetical protein